MRLPLCSANHLFPLPPPAAQPALPLFPATLQDNKVVLEWTVGENENSRAFEVEKAFDGKKSNSGNLYSAAIFRKQAATVFWKARNIKQKYRIKIQEQE